MQTLTGRTRALLALAATALVATTGPVRAQDVPRADIDSPRLRLAVADARAIGGAETRAKELSETLRKALAAHPQIQVVSGEQVAAALAASEGDILALKEGAARALGDGLGVDAVVYPRLIADVAGLTDDPVPAAAPSIQLLVVETLTLEGQLYPGPAVPTEPAADLTARLVATTLSLLPAPGKVLAIVQSPEGSLTQLFPIGGRVLAANAEYGVFDGLSFTAGIEDPTGRSALLARQDLRPGVLAGRVRTGAEPEDHLAIATSTDPAGRVAVGQLVGLLPPAGAPPVAPALPTILVASVPGEAIVTLDGAFVGVTPVAVPLQAGHKATITLQRRDHRTATYTVTPAAGEALAMYPTLQELPPVGSLRITTTPPGALATLDNKDLGKTPFTGEEVAAGEHHLALALEGYKPVTQTVLIRRQRATEVAITLEKDFRKVRVLSDPAGARVLLDGEAVGTTPLDLAAVQTGTRELQLTLPGHAVERQKVTIEPGDVEEVLRFRMRAVAGNLRVETDPPGAAVTLDGQDKGKTPLALTAIPVGEHRVEVKLDGYLPIAKTVTVEDQRTAEVKEALTRAEGRILCTSVPAGAKITLDGNPAGTTPATLEHVPIGKRRLTLELAGFEAWTARVPVLHGETTKVEVGLIRATHGGVRRP